jgi:hypothetical protein
MIFNELKKTLDLYFFFRGEEIDITSTYTYLGVQFSGPRFSLRPTLHPWINKGHRSLAFSRDSAFDTIFKTSHPRCPSWTPLFNPLFSMARRFRGLLYLKVESDWASAERFQTLLLQRIIRCKQAVPQHIILAEFRAQPFRLETLFILVSFLHHILIFVDSVKGRDRYPYLAYCSSKTTALSSPSGWSRGWFVGVSNLLESMGIQMDRLPPFRYSLDALGQLLPTGQELNRIIKDDIYRQFI